MDQNIWRERILRRSDMTGRLTHLTKGADNDAAFDTLWKILKDKKLIAGSGYVIGDQRVVCFQETPLGALEENLFFEKKLKEDSNDHVRYLPFGLRFNKGSLYIKGARPVVYGDPDELKSVMPTKEHWRIVKHNLSDPKQIVDWTHEREWRHPGDLDFDYGDIEVIVEGHEFYKKFVNRCIDEKRLDVLKEINGIIPLFSVVG